jgi:hypothetical protein
MISRQGADVRFCHSGFGQRAADAQLLCGLRARPEIVGVVGYAPVHQYVEA